MVTLRVVVDGILERSPRGVARYSEELTRALIQYAPADCQVEAILPAHAEGAEEELRNLLPGLAAVHSTTLARRELRAAWQLGLATKSLGGMIHSPTLLAPLGRHNRHETPGEQTVVTIHDASAWLFPRDAGANGAWLRAMAKRARKHADAVVVPTHAVANDLSEHVDFGDRIRVVSGAMSSHLALPADIAAVVDRLALPDDFVAVVGTLEPRRNIESLFKAVASPRFPDLPLVFVGPSQWNERTVEAAIFESGAPAGTIIPLEPLADSDLAVVISRARALVLPSQHEGFGLPAIEAMHFGTPLIHSDAPALIEVVAEAGAMVEGRMEPDYDERLAEMIGLVVGDEKRLELMSVAGRDRSHVFSWRDSAEKVWQLHADL